MNISKIAIERKKLGLSQEELASRLKVSQKSISKYECGTRRPSYETLLEMSKLFNVSIDYLLDNPVLSDAISKPEHQIGSYDNSINNWIGKTGLSNNEAAQKLGIPEDLLLDYIKGKIPIPYQILSALSEICEVSTDCLLGIRNKSRGKDFDNTLPFQYNYKIAERIRKLCDTSPVSTNSSFLENLLSLSNQEIFYLIEYGFIPHIDTIIKLANYFNVSPDYLLCQIDEQDDKALRSFCQLNEDNKDIIVGEIKKLLKEQLYEKSVAEDKSLKKTGTDNMGK